MDENAKTNEFKEMAKAALGELSNEEIEKLKKFMETSGDISEHHGNCEELSDEQLESVGGGLTKQNEAFLDKWMKMCEIVWKNNPNITDEYKKLYREKLIDNLNKSEERQKNTPPTPQRDPWDYFAQAWIEAADYAYNNRK